MKFGKNIYPIYIYRNYDYYYYFNFKYWFGFNIGSLITLKYFAKTIVLLLIIS